MALAGGCRSGCRRVARRRDRGGPARVVGPVRAARRKGAPRVEACRRRAYNRGRAVARGSARRPPREGGARAPGRPTGRARRRQRARSLFRDSCPSAGRSRSACRRFGRGRRSVHARRRSAARRLARSRGRGARSRSACRSREQPSRVPRCAARARAGGIGGGAAAGGERGSAARRGFTDGARERAESGHRPVAPRAAAEPCRRQRKGLPRSRGGARAQRSARRGAAHRPRRGVDRGLAPRVRFRCCGGCESCHGSASARRRVRGAHRARERRRRRAGARRGSSRNGSTLRADACKAAHCSRRPATARSII